MISGPSKSLFKSIVAGHAAAVTAIFLPVFLVGFTAQLGILQGLSAVLIVPIIALLQGLIIGGLVSFGLWLVSRIRPSLIQS
jgi:hypothetical protein